MSLLAFQLKFQPQLTLLLQYNTKKPMSESSDHSYTKPRPSKYSKISQKTKEKLIQLVLQKNTKISSAAKILKIKHSTAKMIVGKYKKMFGKVAGEFDTFCNQNKNVGEENGEQQRVGHYMGFFLPGYFYFSEAGSMMGMFYLLNGQRAQFN